MNNKLSPFLVATTGLLCANGCSCSAQASEPSKGSKKPNIILINADDLGWAELGCYGNTFNETPNLDALAKAGVRFSQAYAAAPISSPSRAGLMSGKYPTRVGITDYIVPAADIHLPLDDTSLAEALQAGGYHTAIIGKWHLSGYMTNGAPQEFRPDCYGFEEVLLSAEESIGNGTYFHPYHYLPSTPKKDEATEHEFIVDRMNEEAVEFIERNQDRPFLLYLAHYAVHSIVHGKPEVVAHFQEKPECGHSEPSKNNPENDPYKKWPADCRAKKNNPHLAAQLKAIDDGVGMIMDKLRELGMEENTIIVFTGDNGGSLNQTRNTPLRGGKGGLYEGGTREPLIVYQKGRISGGKVSNLPTVNYDLYPTLCELTGTPVPEGEKLDGVSIASELCGKGSVAYDRNLFWLFKIQTRTTGGRPSNSLRQGDWKLIEFFDTGEVELYNLKDDLSETNNLAATYTARTRDMQKTLSEWRKDVKFE